MNDAGSTTHFYKIEEEDIIIENVEREVRIKDCSTDVYFEQTDLSDCALILCMGFTGNLIFKRAAKYIPPIRCVDSSVVIESRLGTELIVEKIRSTVYRDDILG